MLARSTYVSLTSFMLHHAAGGVRPPQRSVLVSAHHILYPA